MPGMDALEIAHRRLHNQHLSGPKLADPAAVVRHLGAAQAQEYALAKWSVGQRVEGCDDAAVQRAVDEGAILRTHVLRPTWHFVAAEDLGWIQAVTAPRVHALSAYYYRMHGLDDETTAKTNAVIADALRGGNHLTRNELGEALGKAGIEATGNRLAYIVMRAELDGLIANGAMRGKQHTYALVSERVAEPRELAPEAALAELTRRYFTSHGPATVKDFAWWSSLTVAQIKRGLELVGEELASEQVDGLTYWFAPADPPNRDRSPTVHILQTFDEYTIGYADSRSVLNLAGLPVAELSENGLMHPITVDSQVVAFWRRVVARRGIVAQVNPGVELSAARRTAVERGFARYGDFTGLPVTVEWLS